jgi:hypothetical protein
MAQGLWGLIGVIVGGVITGIVSWHIQRRRIGAERQMSAYSGVYTCTERIRFAFGQWPKSWGSVEDTANRLRAHVRENAFLLNKDIWKMGLRLVDKHITPWYQEEEKKEQKGPVPKQLRMRCTALMRKAQRIMEKKFSLDLSA